MPEPMKVTPVSRTPQRRWIVEDDHGKLWHVWRCGAGCENHWEVKTRQRHFINPDGPTGRRVIAAVEATLSAESPPPRPGPENVSAGHTDPTTNHQEETP